MSHDAYRKLAQKLDAIPNGFPQTESGIELKLLAKIYTPEEAALASEMQLVPECAARIAERTGRDQAKTVALLEEMVRKGLIRVIDEEGQCKFGLMPWIVGVYEEQLGRLDEEFVRLFDEYILEATLGWTQLYNTLPSVEKVIPVEKSIPVDVQIFPYEQASALLENAKSFGVRKCICKVNRALARKRSCKYPVEVCLVFAATEGAFDNQPDTRTITKEEALKILRETEEAGLIHSSSNVREGHFYICNCCTCCCAFMRALSRFGIENSVAKSDFYARSDPETCTGCGTCVKRCQFGVPSLVDDKSSVDQKRCVGCGQCVMTCPSGAMTLVRKPQISPIPHDFEEWALEKAKNRGIPTEELAGANLNLPLLSNARARIFRGE
jgi:electron transport complex protein RnfB